MSDESPLRTFQSAELYKDADGYYLKECPECGQTWSNVYIGAICIDCESTIYLEEATVSWNE